MCVLAAGAALAGWVLPASWLDWQPALAWREPWRWWTAAAVHWSAMHLLANLAGCAVLAAFGTAARLPRRAAVAWALAWPLTHGALLLQPALAHYGGLSGVLHAGVAVAALHLLARGEGRREGGREGWREGWCDRRRLVGAAVLGALAFKLVRERPWAGPLAYPDGWDIALAPLAHLTGALAGGVGVLLVAVRTAASPAAGPTMPPP